MREQMIDVNVTANLETTEDSIYFLRGEADEYHLSVSLKDKGVFIEVGNLSEDQVLNILLDSLQEMDMEPLGLVGYANEKMQQGKDRILGRE